MVSIASQASLSERRSGICYQDCTKFLESGRVGDLRPGSRVRNEADVTAQRDPLMGPNAPAQGAWPCARWHLGHLRPLRQPLSLLLPRLLWLERVPHCPPLTADSLWATSGSGF